MLITKDKNEMLKQKENEDLLKVLERIDKEKPKSEDVAKAEEILTRNSYLWEAGFGLSGTALWSYIRRIEKIKSQQLFIEAEAKYIKEQLGYSATNQIEKLIIEQILLCWIGVIHIERRLLALMTQGSHTTEEGEYWQNTLTRYQNHYLRAIEMLARVRKLNKGIAFQVNIAADGGQQVNVNEMMPNKEI
jgi:hypothetical protein